MKSRTMTASIVNGRRSESQSASIFEEKTSTGKEDGNSEISCLEYVPTR